ncbi:MAG TPA: hypothetical protein PKC87_03255 [Candidatus Absconditabacterales bacterium]|nr:hypothetical protein [Candidatus Absconditabacterales bacterium]
MRKLALRVLSFMTFGILIAGSGIALAQNTPSGFGDVTSTSNVGVSGTGTAQGGKLIDVIKSFINWMLGILALIALVILLWGGFQMVTAAGDDGKYKKGFKILQQAAIGLVFIGVSWLIVSVIFWLLGVIGV